MALGYRVHQRRVVVMRLVFGHPSEAGAAHALGAAPTPTAGEPPQELRGWIERLTAYAEGEPVALSDIVVDQSHLSAFARRVSQRCRAIPYGTTRTYGQLAAEAGSVGAARAVGSVMASNRTPLITPCHRVLGAGGRLGGFSAPQGVAMKRRLLEIERAGGPSLWPAQAAGERLPAV